MNKMEPKLKAAWVAALRSGKYPQTTGKLQNRDRNSLPDGFCCLGVFCEINGIAYVVNQDSLLPSAARRLFDFSQTTLVAKETSLYIDTALMEMNDSKKKTFAEIADWIEVNL